LKTTQCQVYVLNCMNHTLRLPFNIFRSLKKPKYLSKQLRNFYLPCLGHCNMKVENRAKHCHFAYHTKQSDIAPRPVYQPLESKICGLLYILMKVWPKFIYSLDQWIKGCEYSRPPRKTLTRLMILAQASHKCTYYLHYPAFELQLRRILSLYPPHDILSLSQS